MSPSCVYFSPISFVFWDCLAGEIAVQINEAFFRWKCSSCAINPLDALGHKINKPL